MEGGARGNLLDPAAAEFHPSPPAVAPAAPFAAVGYPQIYYPYAPPPPPQPPATQFFTATPVVPAYHNQYQPHVLPPVNALSPTTTAVAVLEGGTEAMAPLAAATRSVALSLVPRGLREGEVKADMELFGGVRGLEMGALQTEGVVTVHFYDLRSAQTAVAEICAQHSRLQGGIGYVVGVPGAGNWSLPTPQWEWRAPHGVAGGGGRGLIAGHAVWAQFAFDDQQHRSSIVVMNSDPNLPLLALRQLFEAFGAVRDVREMATKPLHKFVEFFDTRDAARAYSELNCRKFHGRRLMLEFTRPFSGNQTSYARRSSALAPRFLRGSNKPAPHSRWNHGASSSLPTSAMVNAGNNLPEPVGAPLMLLQRSQTNAATTSSSSITGAGCSSSSNNSGKRIKNNSSHQPSSSSSSTTPSTKHHGQTQQQQPQTSGSKKGWKNQAKSNGGDKRFLFQEVELDDSAASASRDPRTTVMIRNIPNKYSQKLLLNMLDNHCIHCNEQIGDGDDDEPYSAYDFVYLPIDFNNKCNVGYGFVNLTSPEAAFRLYKAFHHQPWEVFNSRKICQVTYARLQVFTPLGLEALMEHFRNSKFACDNDEYMPVYFSPPRDGKLLTEPVPVVPREGSDSAISLTTQVVDGMSKPQDGGYEDAAFLQAEIGGASSTTASTHAPSDNADDEEDDIGQRFSGDDHDDDGVGEEYSESGLSDVLLRLSCGN